MENLRQIPNKKNIRQITGRASRFYLGYYLLFSLGTMAAMLPLFINAKGGEVSDSQIDQFVTDYAGELSLVGLAFGLLFILLKRRKKLWREDLATFKQPVKAFSPKLFGFCILLTFVAQGIYLIFQPGVEWLANQIGFTMQPYLEEVWGGEETPMFVLYAGIFGPIMEEIVFRGVLLHQFEKLGKVFAIITSSVLFGVFHGELTQGFFAFWAGLILAWLTLEYSIKWAMALHIFNNLIISSLMTWMLSFFPENIGNLISNIIVIVGALLGVIMLWKNRQSVKNYLQHYKTRKGIYRWSWTSIWFILIIVISIILFFSAFSSL